MAERSAAERLGQIRKLERALLTYMSELHRYGVCGADGRHTAECRAFFQTFGWDSYEEFKAAVDDPVQQLAAARHLAGLDA